MEGATYTLGRMTLAFKNPKGESEAAFSVVEALEPTGSGAGCHRHPSYDETFMIIEGHYEFQLGDEKRAAGPGDVIFVPRGVAHGFKVVGPETGRQIVVSAPGGILEGFIKEVSEAMVDTGAGSAAPAVDFRGIAARHGIEFI
jgi:quercetin dioxygenase-like cupin family protein